MSEQQELIWEFQKLIISIYRQYELTCLRGFEDDDFKVNGRQIIMWHSEVTRKNALKYSGRFNYLNNFDDLLFCSDELLYFTAHLYLYRPFINNPVNDGFPFAGEIVYPNYQNLEAKRYSMFADITSQKAYNYWDRIGDLISSFFPDHIKPHRIFFPTAIEAIPLEFHASEHYIWLKKFKETDYLELNKIRKQVVHYLTSQTDFNHRHLARTRDREAIQALQNEREHLADFYKNHITLTITGFEKALLFLEDVNKKLFEN